MIWFILTINIPHHIEVRWNAAQDEEPDGVAPVFCYSALRVHAVVLRFAHLLPFDYKLLPCALLDWGRAWKVETKHLNYMTCFDKSWQIWQKLGIDIIPQPHDFRISPLVRGLVPDNTHQNPNPIPTPNHIPLVKPKKIAWVVVIQIWYLVFIISAVLRNDIQWKNTIQSLFDGVIRVVFLVCLVYCPDEASL